MNSCPEQERIQEYVDGELASEQASIIAGHINSCPECQRLYRQIKAISDSLAQQPRPAASEQLKQHILQAISQAQPVQAITCEVAQQLISPYLDGELSPVQRPRVEAHIFTCADCYRMFKQTQQITAALHVALPVAAPAGLDVRVHSAVDQAAAKQPQVVGYIGRRISWPTVGAALAGAAAAAVIVFGLILSPRELPLGESPESVMVAVPPTVEPVVEPAAADTESVEVEESAPAVRGVVVAHRAGPKRIHRPGPTRHVVGTGSERPSSESTVAMVSPEADLVRTIGEPLPPSASTTGLPVPAESPASPQPAAVDEPRSGPRIVLVPPDTTDYVGPPGPALAALPAAADEPTWTPVRAKLTPVYYGGDQVPTKRLSEATSHVNQRIAELRDNELRGWSVVK